MQSSSLTMDKRRRTFVRFLGEIKHALNQALAEEFKERKLTRKHMADILGVDKSFITKKLMGESNMTIETLADLAFALDRPIKISLPSRHANALSNSHPGMATLETSTPGNLPLNKSDPITFATTT